MEEAILLGFNFCFDPITSEERAYKKEKSNSSSGALTFPVSVMPESGSSFACRQSALLCSLSMFGFTTLAPIDEDVV
jgi:hypothetical protein